MARKPLTAVRETLEEYANRGVLRGFTQRAAPDGRAEFVFSWLGNRPFRVYFDEAAHTLRVDGLLRAVPAGSRLDADLKRFVATRMNGSVPPHRGVDPGRATLSAENRDDVVSLTLAIHKNQFTYGVRKLLNVVNEVFILLNASHQEYMWEHFDVPME